MFSINQRATRNKQHIVGRVGLKMKPIIYQPKVSEHSNELFNDITIGKTVVKVPVALSSVREQTKSEQERKDELKVLFNRTRDRYDKTFRDLVNL